MRTVEHVARLNFPAPLPFAVGSQHERKFFEAASQGRQLIDSVAVWPDVDPEVLRRKLQTIAKGDVLVEHGADDDPARNALAEIVVATMFKGRGRRVRVTDPG